MKNTDSRDEVTSFEWTHDAQRPGPRLAFIVGRSPGCKIDRTERERYNASFMPRRY